MPRHLPETAKSGLECRHQYLSTACIGARATLETGIFNALDWGDEKRSSHGESPQKLVFQKVVTGPKFSVFALLM